MPVDDDGGDVHDYDVVAFAGDCDDDVWVSRPLMKHSSKEAVLCWPM